MTAIRLAWLLFAVLLGCSSVPPVTITKHGPAVIPITGGPVIDPALRPASAFYADTGVTLVTGAVSSWLDSGNNGATLAQGTPASRPTMVVDTVTGQTAIRFDAGQTLAMATGKVNYLSQGGATVLLVWRTRNYSNTQTDPVLLDSSGNGASSGYQLRAKISFGGGQYRQLLARISNGSTWVVDQPAAPTANAFAALKWNIAAVTTSPTRAAIDVDNAIYADHVIAATLPSGAGGVFTVGNCQIDVLAIELYSSALSDSARNTALARLAARFEVDPMVLIAGNATRHYGFPSMCKLPNGNLLVAYREGVGHSGDVGSIVTQTSTDGGATWAVVGVAQVDATLDSRDPQLVTLANGDVLLSFFLAPIAGGNERVWFRRSSNNGVTWGAPQQVVSNFTDWVALSAPIVERSASGALYMPVYGANIAAAHSSAHVIVSTDNGATWPTEHVLADGVADGVDYGEPGIVFTSDTTAVALTRNTSSSTMWESTSSNAGVTWSAQANVISGNSAGRLLQFASGKIVWLGRPTAQQMATIFKRISAGSWSIVPTAPTLDAYPVVMIYGTMLETSAGKASVVYSTQLAANIADVRFRHWDEWQLDGAIPRTVSPSAVTLAPFASQQFTATGAGNFTWSIAVNNSVGASISATGLYTAGDTGSVVDTVRATDLNGATVDALVTLSATSTTQPKNIDAANFTAWWDPRINVVDGGTPLFRITSWTDRSTSAWVLPGTNNITPGTGLGGHKSVDIDGSAGSGFTGSNAISNFVAAAAWTVGGVFRYTGNQTTTGLFFTDAGIIGDPLGGGGRWGVSACKSQMLVGQDDGAGKQDATVIANGDLVKFIAKYDGTRIYTKTSVNGGAWSAFDAGTLAGNIANRTNAIIVGRAFSNPFTGSIGDLATWKVALSDSNVALFQAYLDAKYA